MKSPEFDRIYVERMKWPPKFSMGGDHMHPYFELYYLLHGTRTYFINHSFYTLHPHDMMLIRGGDLHHTTYHTEEACERILIYFDEEMLSRLYATYGKEQILSCFIYPKCSIPPEKQSDLLSLLTAMGAEQAKMDPYSMTIIQNLFEELILLLLRIQKDVPKDPGDTISDLDITLAARYICSNFHKELTLEQVAKIANISPTYFSKKFKSLTGFGFKEYLNRIRLKEAAKCLTETKDSITSIALHCGFNDSNYFGDSFKKVYGASPRSYRKQSK